LYTPYQAKYWAHALTLKGSSGSMDALSRSIANARVDLNPHQVDAALFAVRSPLSKGVLLADEVGLGKTIEAGLVIAQRWAERRRKILLILPATLRKQWQQELEEKFHLPSVVLESRLFNRLRGEGHPNPFDRPNQIVLCSYHFAANKAESVSSVPWDMVVIDEAHRLRNVYKSGNVQARAIAGAVEGRHKLLLTATPLQNSLLELYGLVTVLDPHVFGDPLSFREQFLRGGGDEKTRNGELRRRLNSVCQRTLRKQVLEYIRFTQRVPLTQEFVPTDEEHTLYEEVSAYLQRKVLIALPASQRALMTMILRKLLASSTFAIAGTLRRLVTRLERVTREQTRLDLEGDVAEDFETLDEVEDEWEPEGAAAQAADPTLLREETALLREYAERAERIAQNAKGEALLVALATALEKTSVLGAARKAVVFTESRRTQQYLFEHLSRNGYDGHLVLMNGTNTDPHSKAIYEAWRARHDGEDTVSGSKPVDIKAAIVEEFRDRGSILIATEAAAEGINLQFCSLVVNYDLPWNPQRIEQRIGRCHRYGQQHDVVVVNFLNKRNAADQRVYQLLSEKFRLFDGVFGSSDGVLGALESGVDIEKRIAQIYQECRTTEEINAAFDAVQDELEEEIQDRMAQTRQDVLDHFDEEVHARLNVHRDEALASLSQRERWLLSLARFELGDDAEFVDGQPRFRYTGTLGRPGMYHLDWKEAEKRGDTFFRLDHPLAEAITARAAGRDLRPAELLFDYAAHGAPVKALEPCRGKAGWLELSKLTVDSFETEEFLVHAAVCDSGERLDEKLSTKLLSLPARVGTSATDQSDAAITAARDAEITRYLREVEERNARHFDQEVTKLDAWADDLKVGLERELKELDRAIKEARTLSRQAATLSEKLEAQREQRALEQKRNKKRRELFDAQDEIDERRTELIKGIELQLGSRHALALLFTIRWRLI